MIGSAGETVLDRRAMAQPIPFIVSGGDCGGCVVGGVLNLPVAEVYARFDSKGITSYGEMQRVLRCAASHEIADRIIEEPCEWRSHGRHWGSFGHPAWLDALAWLNYVRMAVDAGYYGIANVAYSRNGGLDTDHWVLLCGARVPAKPPDHTGGWKLRGDVLVSCSAAGGSEEWVDAKDFLEKRGGYDVLFVRPAQGPQANQAQPRTKEQSDE